MTARDYYTRKRLAAAGAASKHKKKEHDMFASPSSPSGGITWADHKGSLLLIEPLAAETGIQTSFGSADAVRANVYVLDGPGAGQEHPDTLVFPKLLQSQLKGQIGAKVLGRLGQGNAKPGQSAPWLLEEATADDIAKAEAWVKTNQSPAVTSAAAPF